jgi:hypothetical protein
MKEQKKVSQLRIKNYLKAYRNRYPHKSIEDAARATLNWTLGIHSFIFEESISAEITKYYKKKIQKLLEEV